MKLNNGKEIPNIGLGTWNIKNKIVAEVVRNAVQLGYRHFDTARVYFNERGVGQGIRTCGIPREEVFVTSKVFGDLKTYKKVTSAIDKSLKRLDIEYIDLMLIHWPKPKFRLNKKKTYFKENREVWRAFEDAYKAGKLKAIGVSNFEIEDLKNLLDHAEIKPMVNQILIHIGHTPQELIDYCQANDVVVEAYSPIAGGKILNNESVHEIAKRYEVSIPQLCIKYTLDLGVVTLPKTANPNHMKHNLVIGFEISKIDLDVLKHIQLKL